MLKNNFVSVSHFCILFFLVLDGARIFHQGGGLCDGLLCAHHTLIIILIIIIIIVIIIIILCLFLFEFRCFSWHVVHIINVLILYANKGA